jgi:hypothetical protein
MATVQHPAPVRIHVRHDLDWLWISLSVVLVALAAGAIAWAVFRPSVEVPMLPAEVVGFEYAGEATAGQAVEPGITAPYFGYSGELYPVTRVAAMAGGFSYENESTPLRIAAAGVTTPYFGYSGALMPASETVRALSQIIGANEAARLIRATDRALAQPAQITDPGEAARLIRAVDRALSDDALRAAMVGGFEFDNPSTSGHLAGTAVTAEYLGLNPALDPER